MSGLPFWGDNDQAKAAVWNTCRLGDVQLPGICSVKPKKGRDVDIKKAKGQDGHTMEDHGSSVGEVAITLILYDRASWEAWQKVRPTIDPNRPGATRKPLEIQHPACADRGIKDVYVVDIDADPPTARGGMRITIHCKEWFAAPKKSKGASKLTKTIPVTALRQNSFVSDVPGETEFGRDFVRNLTGENF